MVASFGVGVYTGIYLAQNYDLPPVDNVDKFLEHLEHKVQELKPIDETHENHEKDHKEAAQDKSHSDENFWRECCRGNIMK